MRPYTFAFSIVVHLLIAGALILSPIVATDVLPEPRRAVEFIQVRPIAAPSVPSPPRGGQRSSKTLDAAAAPVVAPDRWARTARTRVSHSRRVYSDRMELRVGDAAPDFTLEASDGRTYRLSDFRGRQPVVIAWFPKAFTSGCTVECRSLAEKGHLIRQLGAKYFMASVDPAADNAGFAAKEGADFPILSDATKEAAKAYGVLNERGTAARWTFYIDKEGRIAHIDTAVRPASSAEDIALKLTEMGVTAPS